MSTAMGLLTAEIEDLGVRNLTIDKAKIEASIRQAADRGDEVCNRPCAHQICR